MTVKRRRKILVVGAINRLDILAMFRETSRDADLVFLEYLYQWGDLADPEKYRPYGSLIYWHEFPHAGALFDAVAPDEVVLFYIDSLNQLVLKLAAQRRRIRTRHLEHGSRLRFGQPVLGSLLRQEFETRFNTTKIRREWRTSLRNHAFFLRSLPMIPDRLGVLAYAREVYLQGTSPAMLQRFGALRQPDEYVAFSPETFDFHRQQDDVRDARVKYFGVPYADAFAGVSPAEKFDAAVLVDHQFHNAAIFGWNLPFRRQWVDRVSDLVSRAGLRLHVKTHPGDRSGSWDEHVRSGRVEVVDHAGLVAIMPRVRLVLGTFSTMQLPLAALPHTCVLTLEIHPETGHFPSRAFVEAGVAEAVTSFEQLENAVSNVEELHARQAPNKAAFERQFLYVMDGNSTRRLRDILVDG